TQDIDIIASYSDSSGIVRLSRVKMSALSASWVLEKPGNGDHDQPENSQTLENSFQADTRYEKDVEHSMVDNESEEGGIQSPHMASMSPVKRLRRIMRQKRRELRTAELIGLSNETGKKEQVAAINQLKSLDTSVKGKYSIWRRDFENPNSDSTLKLMRDQIILAKAYANIAKSKKETSLYNSLMKHSRQSEHAIGEANSDTELHLSALDQAKAMGHVLSIAKDQLYDCPTVSRTFRAMLQSTEDNVSALKKKSAFLIQLAAKTVPKPLHCLHLQLAADYFVNGYQKEEYQNEEKLNKGNLEDPSLYHYAIFSDNVLATSVVVNSTVLHAKEPEKHVFHIVTDKLNFAAMKMWFRANSPANATIETENIDDFKWLNSSYCSVLRQLESARLKEYYFKANHPSSLSAGADNLKYRNPKYLSMLNHLRFYLPEVYPKLDKILFLDDDIVVQKDLTPLWSIDLQGRVNGAVETCKESFHRFDKYLNFSNPKISNNFDPNSCGWAFGMNMFDLKEWRKRNITGIYHRWQDMNEDRTLWKLGSLPPGLITFYNLTYPLERSWHVLGLGYDPALNQTEIENAAVIHYNGNNKPWLDLAVAKYKSYCMYAAGGLWVDAARMRRLVKEREVRVVAGYSLVHIGNKTRRFVARDKSFIGATTKLTKALLKNTTNPKLAWQLFKRILSSPTTHSPHSITTISHILVRAQMYSEIDILHQLLVALKPHQTSHSSLISLVRVLAQSGLVDKAFSQFKTVRTEFPQNPPSIYLYNVLLQSFIRESRVDYVLWLYKDMVVACVSPETYTFNLLISALCDLGWLEDARGLFDKMSDKGCKPNEYSLGILVRGYCRAGFTSQGLELLDEMGKSGFSPNKVVYNTLISSFCRDGRTDDAEKLVERMRQDSLFPDVVTFNSRISALCKVGKILEASRIFRDMQIDEDLGLPRPNKITYNLMLDGFCKEGMLEEAKSLIESMKKVGDLLNLESYHILLQGFVRNGKLFEAQAVLSEMVDEGIQPNNYSYNILMNGLCKNGMLSEARRVMDVMISSGTSPDTVTYSTLLHGYCSKRKLYEANNVLREMMRSNCSPNNYTCNILLHSLWKEGKISEAEELLQKMNERGYGLDTVTCNIIIDGLCNGGKVDKAIEIANGMWTHGSAALANLGNSFIGLVEDSNKAKNCMPDLVTYSIIISGLCKAGRLDEAKKKFIELMGKNLEPDSIVYDTVIHSFCKEGKISSAFRVLKDMEKKGCNKSLQTYNSLILGLGKKNQIFEIYGLMNEMRERGVSPNACTYNNIIRCLCERGKFQDATSILDEMLQKGTAPNIASFRMLIEAFCKAGDFRVAQEVFEIALSICGHKEKLYSVMFNELLVGREISEAKDLFEAAIDRSFYVGNFLYKDLIDRFCQDEILEDAIGILSKMIDKGYGFDPAAFIPVIEGLGKMGNKHKADELAEKMMEMTSEGRVTNKAYSYAIIRRKQSKYGGNDWQTILHRDDGSGIALKAVKRVQRGWGQGSIPSLQAHNNEFLEYWEGSG
ncbi:Glyco_transf_8 domain-containing protein/PPR domain-containing protein/PPR_1 domain-containing protein/PPR_2 domain-containing protein, partial [Cephalotus follicularis]